MFTVKLYRNNNAYQRIYEAESFTILRYDNSSADGPIREPDRWAEVTVHRKDQNYDFRFDVGHSDHGAEPSGGVWDKAIIENSQGKTTEIVWPF